MAAATVRADYDQLKQAASTFGKNSDSCKQTLQSLKSNMDTLQGGDWIGQGANAFYKEMDDSVLPTFQRLINALNTAQNSLAQISSLMKDAEDQAANVLKGPGGSSSPIGASFGAATGAGLGAAMGTAPAGPMGASSPAGSPARASRVFASFRIRSLPQVRAQIFQSRVTDGHDDRLAPAHSLQ